MKEKTTGRRSSSRVAWESRFVEKERHPPVIRKKEDRVLTGRQPWELGPANSCSPRWRFCTLSLPGHQRNNVLEKERFVPREKLGPSGDA